MKVLVLGKGKSSFCLIVLGKKVHVAFGGLARNSLKISMYTDISLLKTAVCLVLNLSPLRMTIEGLFLGFALRYLMVLKGGQKRPANSKWRYRKILHR